MTKIDLKSMSLGELKALNKRVEKAIAGHEKKKKAKALAALKAKAKEMGFSLAELTGGAAPKAKPAAAKRPKVAYRDTADKNNVWSGRGPRPKWLRAALESGKSLEDFKV